MSYVTLKNKLDSKTVLVLGIFLIICAFTATKAQAAGCDSSTGECSWDNIFPSGGNYNPNGVP